MRAQIRTIDPLARAMPIQLIFNQMTPVYVEPRLAAKKYKKVGKEVRTKLLRFIQKGWSIINVAKRFGINYSTAKSIVQTQKKKTRREDSDRSDARISTDECQSGSVQCDPAQ